MVSILPGLYWLETEDVQCRDSVSKKNHTPGQQMDIGQRRRPGSHPEGEQADIVLFLRSPMNFFHPPGGRRNDAYHRSSTDRQGGPSGSFCFRQTSLPLICRQGLP